MATNVNDAVLQGTMKTSGGLAKMAFTTLGLMLTFAFWLLVSAPYGDRQSGIPQPGEPAERGITRFTQWASAYAWVTVIPISVGVIAMAHPLTMIALPFIPPLALYIFGRRWAADSHIHITMREFFPHLWAFAKGKVLYATVIVWAPLISYFLYRVAGRPFKYVLLSFALGWVCWVVFAAYVGRRHAATVLEDTCTSQEAAYRESTLLSALLGVSTSSVAEAGTHIVHHDETRWDIERVPEAAFVNKDRVNARVEERFPGLYSAFAPEYALIQIQPLDEAEKQRRALAERTRGLIAGVTETGSVEADSVDFDFSDGL